MAIVINYSDGTSRRFLPSSGATIPQTIVDLNNAQTITSLQLELYATIDYTGTPTGWDVTGTLIWDLFYGANLLRQDLRLMIPASGGTPPLNQAFVIASSTVTASDLEALNPDPWIQDGIYTIAFKVTAMTFTLNFPTGDQYKSAEASANWAFKYQYANSFNSLSVSWNTVPLY